MRQIQWASQRSHNTAMAKMRRFATEELHCKIRVMTFKGHPVIEYEDEETRLANPFN